MIEKLGLNFNVVIKVFASFKKERKTHAYSLGTMQDKYFLEKLH
jgi:hypothetical protein